MLWKVRALLEDRPGALAALAGSCGEQSVNILGLQIFPAADGRVVDEFVLHTPGGWAGVDVERLCVLAGVEDPAVTPCSAHALEDQPVRYLRAAQILAEEPERLEEVLCRLLDASPDNGLPGTGSLRLDDGDGPAVALTRRGSPFTDTELARAQELRRLVAHGLSGGGPTDTVAAPAPGPGPDPDPGSTSPATGEPVRAPHGTRAPIALAGWASAALAIDSGPATEALPARPVPPVHPVPQESPVLRVGSAEDTEALIAMHLRCSAETVYRRYHSPVPHLTPRMARALLVPPAGASMLLTVGTDVVAAGMFGPYGAAEEPGQAELGLMVEDAWQRRGEGARLLRALAVEAADRGLETLICMVQPDNQAMLRTIRRANLRARVTYAYGLAQYRIPVSRLRTSAKETKRRRGNRPLMGVVTSGLVPLLHERPELREVYPPADLIDQAVRGGA